MTRDVSSGHGTSALRALAALSSRHCVPVLFAVFIALRAALLLIPLQPVSDAGWYYNRGLGLAAGQGYSEGGVLTAFWPPGWPLVLAGIFKAFGASLLNVQLFNLVCACLGAWLTLDLGRRLFDSELAGRMALLIVTVYPNHAAYTPLVLTEVLYTTLTLAGCWLLVVRPKGLALVLAGVVFGLSTLVKAQSLLLIPLVFFIAAWRGDRSVSGITQGMLRMLTVGVCAVLVVLPWSMRNHDVFGDWIFVSTNGGFTLLTGNNPSANGGYTPGDPLVTSVKRSVAVQVEADREYKRRGVEWIKNNPVDFLILVPKKLFLLWAPDGEAEYSYQAGYADYEKHWPWFRAVRFLNQAFYGCLMALFVWSGWVLASGRRRVQRKRVDWWLLPYAVALYPTLIAIVFSGQARFHYPVMPFVAMVCGWFIVTRLRESSTGSRSTAP